MTPGLYTVAFTAHAERQFEKLPLSVQGRILSRIQALADDPRPPGCRKLAGQEIYRIRVGITASCTPSKMTACSSSSRRLGTGARCAAEPMGEAPPARQTIGATPTVGPPRPH